MAELSAEESLEVNILFALNKCLAETAHGLQYLHKHKAKYRVKQVIDSIDRYDKEINRTLDPDQIKAVESIYDCIMDLLNDAKVTAIENYNNENLLNDK
jgi:uncharacterized membrane protein